MIDVVERLRARHAQAGENYGELGATLWSEAAAEIDRLREALPVLAAAILDLAKKAATTWDYDGEQITGTGVMLDLERELETIAALAKEAEPMSHFAAPQEAGEATDG